MLGFRPRKAAADAAGSALGTIAPALGKKAVRRSSINWLDGNYHIVSGIVTLVEAPSVVRPVQVVRHADLENDLLPVCQAVDAQIDETVAAIRSRAAELRRSYAFREWDAERRPSGALPSMEVLHVSDDIGFHTIAEACNATMGCSYKGIQRAFFRPKGLVANDIDMLAWFPKLSIDGINASTSTGWANTISPDGERIFQYNAINPKIIEHDRERPERIVFARMLDPVSGIWSYRFVGIFGYAGIGENANGMRSEVFERTSDEWRIIK